MSELIACHGCDQILDVSKIHDGCKASCSRCGHVLTSYQSDAMAKVVAYSVSAGIFLLIANSFSFLTLTAKGLKSAMTLPETALALYRYGLPELAVLVAAFIILIPALVLLLLFAISLPLSLDRPARWLKPAARAFYTLHEWSMVEVFLIGVVVSLIKLSHMAEVELGFSFWAYVTFSICFTLALTTIDRYQCWRKIEEVQARG